MREQEVVVSSWSELQAQLYEGSWHEALQRFRPGVAYRGMARADTRLGLGLARLGEEPGRLEGICSETSRRTRGARHPQHKTPRRREHEGFWWRAVCPAGSDVL